jgi:L-ascorbate metabolism protein UlaG (beta-lactamase superfamily)
MRATFLGVSTVLLDDGQTAIMTDGFFSRPGPLRSLLRPIAPDDGVIDACLRRAGVTRLGAVLVSHSHYDHALDSPAVAARTGAQVVGSHSTELISRGHGLAADRFRLAVCGEAMTYGSFTVTPIRAEHTPKPRFQGHIEHAVSRSASIREYKMGECYSWHIAHPDGSLIVHASTNFVPRAYEGVHAETVYLGIATLGRLPDEFKAQYWQVMVREVGARRVVPIHWDNFFKPLNRPLVPLPRVSDDLGASLRFLRSRGAIDKVEIAMPVAWETVDPFAAG